jgi:hypothetical protein
VTVADLGSLIPFPVVSARNKSAGRESAQPLPTRIGAAPADRQSTADTSEAVDISHKSELLEKFDQIRRLIEAGRIADFIFVGRDVQTKHFLTEVALNVSNRTELFAFVGITDALKLELTEQAQLAPSIMPDGSILDPYEKELRL